MYSKCTQDIAMTDDNIALRSLSNNITVHDLTASWSMDNNKLTLQNISFSLNNVIPDIFIVT